MSINIAINGYGRIGRNILRAVYENNLQEKIKIKAINDLSGINTSAHLTRFDSTHGRFTGNVSVEGEHMIVNGDAILLTASKSPQEQPWKALDIDVVMECTGHFTARDAALLHVQAGAKKVLISAPGKNADATIVYGVNHHSLKDKDIVVSNASCTTNCLAPLVKPLHESFTVLSGLMNTVHAYTKDQMLLDGAHADLHRARAAAHSIIPTSTGAAKAVGLVLPELAGKLDGFATRVPTLNVSAVDLTIKIAKETSVEEVNQCLVNAAQGPLNGVLAINDIPLVSCDFNHHPASSIFDLSQTKVIGDLVKVFAWYDNEWGFSNRMIDTARCMMAGLA